MLSYTTLGSGQATRVLAVIAHGDATTVTTCDHDAAVRIARAATNCYLTMPYAMYSVAVELDGTATQARRHLLNVFDTNIAGHPVMTGGTWTEAEALVAAVADAVRTQSHAVTVAVRNELGKLLDGLDGVLVPCTISAGGWRRSEAHVVAPLETLDWPYMLGQHGDLSSDNDGGVELVSSLELGGLPHVLYDAEPAAWSEASIQDVFAAVDDSGTPEVALEVRHVLAWVAHHRPDDLAAVTAALAR